MKTKDEIAEELIDGIGEEVTPETELRDLMWWGPGELRGFIYGMYGVWLSDYLENHTISDLAQAILDKASRTPPPSLWQEKWQ